MFPDILSSCTIKMHAAASQMAYEGSAPIQILWICREPDSISEIRKGRLRWLGHVERMPEERTVKKGFKNFPEGKKPVGRPRKRRLDDVESGLTVMGV
jgi:hypothetical protein